MERRAWRTGQGLRAGVGWRAPGWGGGGERRRARPSLPRSPPPRGGGNGCGTRPHAGRWRARARQWARQRARAAERQPPARPTASPGGEAPVERGGGGEGGGVRVEGVPATGRRSPPAAADGSCNRHRKAPHRRDHCTPCAARPGGRGFPRCVRTRARAPPPPTPPSCPCRPPPPRPPGLRCGGWPPSCRPGTDPQLEALGPLLSRADPSRVQRSPVVRVSVLVDGGRGRLAYSIMKNEDRGRRGERRERGRKREKGGRWKGGPLPGGGERGAAREGGRGVQGEWGG